MTTDDVLRYCQTNDLLQPDDRVLVAFSGGQDSVCLLSILWDLRSALNLNVSAHHVHHGIRGQEADRDAAFCAAFCAERGIPFTVESVDVPAEAEKSGESEELCARRLRYASLQRACPAGGKIATAHQADDNAETVLFHLARGTGLKGLCGIPPKRGSIIRPLLFCTREEISAYCKDNQLPFVEDSTNASDSYTRNRIRQTWMPLLTAQNPSVLEALTRMCDGLRQDESALDGEATAFLADHPDDALPLADLQAEAPAVAKRILKRFLSARLAGSLEAQHLEAAYALLWKNTTLQLPNGEAVRTRAGVLEWVPKTACPAFSCPFVGGTSGEVRLPNGGAVRFHKYPYKDLQKLHKRDLANAVDCAKIDHAVFRSRQAGDVFTDAARGVSKTLKKWLNELQIPPESRNRVALLVSEDTVLWCAPLGASAFAKPDSTTESFYIFDDVGE